MKNVEIEIKRENSNDIAIKYTPLVHKITRQIWYGNGTNEYDDLLSNGFIGLLYAIDRYDEASGKTFIQYASYMIKFHILNYINNGIDKTIKIHSAVSKRNAAKGIKEIRCVSMDNSVSSDNHSKTTINIKDTLMDGNDIDIINNISGDVEGLWTKVFENLSNKFSEKDIEIFSKRFGMNGEDRVKGIDIAKCYNTNSANITNTCNRIIKYMRSDKRMNDMLLDILQRTNI